MFLLNWMEVQQVWTLLLDQTTKNWNPNVAHLPVVAFMSIPNLHFPMLPNDIFENHSTNQYYDYKICWSVICDKVNNDLQLHGIWPLVHSRWLTLACRILHLYTAAKNSSKNLINLAQFCLKAYFLT